ncbi:MAG TPA: acyl-CoA dehydrogenase family protein [Dehalococcoidia bacterium]|nr:acyl-CoA dehydrogenase family protein [Dehalococcoidia bacterium]
MDFRFTPEEEAFRKEVQAFLKEELKSGWDEKFDAESELGVEAQGEFAKAFNKKLAERGWLAPAWPKQYGGMEASVMQQVVYNEEMAYNGAPVGFNMGVAWVGPSLMLYGTEEQKSEFIPKITSLEHTWCTLYSEPAAGSDLAAIETKAVRDGDDYVLNGQKIWTTGAHRSNWGWLAARTDPDAPKHKGISMFLVPMDAPGITIRPLINMAGNHGFNEVFFEDVRIPASYLVGQENMGWYMLAVALDFERSSIAGSARIRRALNELADFARDNPEFVENKPEIRGRMAEIGIEVEIGAALSYRVASMQADGKAPNYEATIAKLYATDLTQRFASTGIELLGLYGPLHPKSKHAKLKGAMERGYQLAVSATIAGGTSEVMKTIGAIRGLGLPRP